MSIRSVNTTYSSATPSTTEQLPQEILNNFLDPVTMKPLLEAIVLFPCGDTFNASTIEKRRELGKDFCAVCMKHIDGDTINHVVRNFLRPYFNSNIGRDNNTPSHSSLSSSEAGISTSTTSQSPFRRADNPFSNSPHQYDPTEWQQQALPQSPYPPHNEGYQYNEDPYRRSHYGTQPHPFPASSASLPAQAFGRGHTSMPRHLYGPDISLTERQMTGLNVSPQVRKKAIHGDAISIFGASASTFTWNNSNTTVAPSQNADPALRFKRGRDLLKAIKKNDFSQCEHLLSQDTDLAVRDGENKTAILLASEKNNIQVLKLLIANGADTKGEDAKEALIHAAEKGFREIVRKLLKEGAPTMEKQKPRPEKERLQYNKEWGTPCRALDMVVKNGDLELLQLFLNTSGQPNGVKLEAYYYDMRCNDGYHNIQTVGGQALLDACKFNHLEVAHMLLEKREDLNVNERLNSDYPHTNYLSNHLYTIGIDLLLLAARTEDLELAQLVLKKGFSPNKDIDHGQILGGEMFFKIIQGGHLKIARFLLEMKLNIYANLFKPQYGYPCESIVCGALKEACRMEHIEMIRLLLETGVDLNHSLSVSRLDYTTVGSLALFQARGRKRSEIIRLFLEKGYEGKTD